MSEKVFEKILANRTNNNQMEYLVKYKNLCYGKSQWISEINLLNAPDGQALLNYYHSFAISVTQEPWYDPQFDQVEKILLCKRKSYLVKWRNLDYDNLTWETRVDQRAIAEFNAREQTVFPTIDTPINGVSPEDGDLLPFQKIAYSYIMQEFSENNNPTIRMDFTDSLYKTVVQFFRSAYDSNSPGPFLILSNFSTFQRWADAVRTTNKLIPAIFIGDDMGDGLFYKYECNDFEGKLNFHVLITTPEVYKCNLKELSRIKWNFIVMEDVISEMPPFNAFTIFIKTISPVLKHSISQTLQVLCESKNEFKVSKTQQECTFRLPTTEYICRVWLSLSQRNRIKKLALEDVRDDADMRTELWKILNHESSPKYQFAMSMIKDFVASGKTILIVGTVLEPLYDMCDASNIKYYSSSDVLTYQSDELTQVYFYLHGDEKLSIVPEIVMIIDGTFSITECLNPPEFSQQISAVYRFIYDDINEFEPLDIRNCIYQSTRTPKEVEKLDRVKYGMGGSLYGKNVILERIISSPKFYDIVRERVKADSFEYPPDNNEWDIYERDRVVHTLLKTGVLMSETILRESEVNHSVKDIEDFTYSLLLHLKKNVQNFHDYPLILSVIPDGFNVEFPILDDKLFVKKIEKCSGEILEKLELMQYINSSRFNRQPIDTTPYPQPSSIIQYGNVIEEGEAIRDKFMEDEGLDRFSLCIVETVKDDRFSIYDTIKVVKKLYYYGKEGDPVEIEGHTHEEIKEFIDAIISSETIPTRAKKQLETNITCMRQIRGLLRMRKESVTERINDSQKWRAFPKTFTTEKEFEFYEEIQFHGLYAVKGIVTPGQILKRIAALMSKEEKQKPKLKPKQFSPKTKTALQYADDVPKVTPKQIDPSLIKKNKQPQFSDLERDRNGNFVVPFAVTQTSTVHSLGKIVRDRAGFKSKSYYYPAGYVSSRLYASPQDPEVRVRWISEVIDTGGESPVFRVWMESDPSISFEGVSPTTPWASVLRYVNTFRKNGGNKTNSISGPEAFLFSAPLMQKVLHIMSNEDVTSVDTAE